MVVELHETSLADSAMVTQMRVHISRAPHEAANAIAPKSRVVFRRRDVPVLWGHLAGQEALGNLGRNRVARRFGAANLALSPEDDEGCAEEGQEGKAGHDGVYCITPRRVRPMRRIATDVACCHDKGDAEAQDDAGASKSLRPELRIAIWQRRQP